MNAFNLTRQEQSVLDYINSTPSMTRTNSEIAQALQMPEPSVRRATKNLENKNRILFSDTFGNQIQWQARQPVADAATV